MDFKTAFDSIFWSALEKLLGAYGIPNALRSVIIETYREATTQVRTPHGLTEAIKLCSGVLQGDTLAPTLFILVIDAIMRELEGVTDPDAGICFGPTRGRWHIRLTHLEFVDDIVILARSAAAAQRLLRKLTEAAAKYGLEVNYSAGKTEVVVLGEPSPREVKRPDGEIVREVQDYKYLGSMLKSSREDFLRNKSQAWQAVHRLKSVWRSTLRTDLKAHLFKVLILPIFLSGAETWFVGTSLLAEISGTYTCMVRHIRGKKVFSRDTRLSNKDLFEEHFPRIEAVLQKKRLRFAGHCVRADQPISKVLLATTLNAKRPGRPHLSFLDVLKKDTGIDDPAELRTRMLDRVAWDRMVKEIVDKTTRSLVTPSERIRKVIKPRGRGSGRPRDPERSLSQAARTMRRVNALKYIDQLVCAAPLCNSKACAEHCTECRHSLAADGHDGSPILTCMYCRRVTAAVCARINLAQADSIRFAFVCKDCSVLLPDLRRR